VAQLPREAEGVRASSTDPDRATSARTLVFTPDSRMLIGGYGTGSNDFRESLSSPLRVWSIPDGRLRALLAGHYHDVTALAVSPDGRTFASGSQREILLWSLADGRRIGALREPEMGPADP